MTKIDSELLGCRTGCIAPLLPTFITSPNWLETIIEKSIMEVVRGSWQEGIHRGKGSYKCLNLLPFIPREELTTPALALMLSGYISPLAGLVHTLLSMENLGPFALFLPPRVVAVSATPVPSPPTQSSSSCSPHPKAPYKRSLVSGAQCIPSQLPPPRGNEASLWRAGLFWVPHPNSDHTRRTVFSKLWPVSKIQSIVFSYGLRNKSGFYIFEWLEKSERRIVFCDSWNLDFSVHKKRLRTKFQGTPNLKTCWKKVVHEGDWEGDVWEVGGKARRKLGAQPCAFIYMFPVVVCMLQLSTHDRDWVTHKAYNIYYLVLHGESLPTP